MLECFALTFKTAAGHEVCHTIAVANQMCAELIAHLMVGERLDAIDTMVLVLEVNPCGIKQPKVDAWSPGELADRVQEKLDMMDMGLDFKFYAIPNNLPVAA